jgi:enoyl-CoA hydratase/carnithine racemase
MDTPEQKVLVETREHIGLIVINRPDQRNAVDGDVADAIEAALDGFDADDNIFAVVLSGAGEKTFCSGLDLKAFAKEGPKGRYFTAKGGFGGVTQRKLAKPLIVAANGSAYGGGMEIVLAADCIVAAEHATFALSEAKIGLMAGGGGAIRLAKRIPRAIALEMIMTGDSISAQRAYELALINAVTSKEGALEGALAVAERIAKASPVAVRVSREVMLESLEMSDSDAWARSMEGAKVVLRSDDCREGQRAFVEKRAPVWTGH